MKKIFIALCLIINFTHSVKSQYISKIDTFKLFFEIDVDQISSQQADVIKQEIQSKDSIVSIQILAYADYLYQKNYNQKLSERRASAVEQVVLKVNTSQETIRVFAKGRQDERSISETIGNSYNRRCDIIINSLSINDISEITIDTVFKVKEKISVEENETSSKFQELSVGDKFVIPNLLFYGSEHFVIPKSKKKLQEIYEALKANPAVNIEIHGHVCCVDEDKDAWDRLLEVARLSETRAEYVYEYLVKKGIDKIRLSHKGFGASQKLFPKEKNSDQKQKNRRIEILITKK